LKGTRPDWFPDWAGQYAAIVGGGASIKRSEVDALKGKVRVVVINESWQLAPWADALYSCDEKWWKLRFPKDFPGLKVTVDEIAPRHFPVLKKLKLRPLPNQPGKYCQWLLMDEWGEVGSGQSGGFQALNWLAQLQVKGIALLGFDACIIDHKIHWHGSHGVELNNPGQSTFVGWKRWLENAAPRLHELGIEVINCSMWSAVSGFQRIELKATLARWGL